MTLQNLEQSLEISKVCQDIMYVCCSNKKIHRSSFINKHGRIVESKLCDDSNGSSNDVGSCVNNLTDKELEMLYMQCKLQSSMNEDFSDKLGHLDYTLVCRKFSFDFIFPFCDGVFFVNADKEELPVQLVANKILELHDIQIILLHFYLQFGRQVTLGLFLFLKKVSL